MKIGILIAVVIYELASILIPGLYLARQVKKGGQESFILSGRDMPWHIVGVTMGLTVLGSAHVFGLMELSWDIGAVSLWFSFAHVILLCVACITTGRWVRRLNVTTVPELLERLYGKNTRIIIACVMAPIIFGLLTMETQAMGICFAAMTGTSIQVGALFGGVIGIFYVILAGMKEIGWVNLINTIVMYAGLIVAAVYIGTVLPGGNWDSVKNYYLNDGQQWMLSIMGTPDLLFNFALGVVIATVFAQGISQMLLQTTMSAKDEAAVKKAMWLAAPVNGLFGIFAVVIGMAAKSIPEFNAIGPKMAGPALIMNLLPDWLIVWLLATFLGALLSTFAMTSLTPATIFVKDLYVGLRKPKATEEEQIKTIRIVIIALAVIAMAVATTLPPMVSGIAWLFAWLVPVFWIVIYGLFWKRSTGVAVTILAVCWVINILWSFTDLPQMLHLKNLTNAHVTFMLSIVLGLLNIFVTGEPAYFKTYKKASSIAMEGRGG